MQLLLRIIDCRPTINVSGRTDFLSNVEQRHTFANHRLGEPGTDYPTFSMRNEE